MYAAISFEHPLWGDILRATITFGAAIGLAVVVKLFLMLLKTRLATRTKTHFDDTVLAYMTTPVLLAIVLVGAYVAVHQVSELDDHIGRINTYFVVGAIALATFSIVRLVRALLTWYALEIAVRTKSDLDEKFVPVIGRIVNVIIYGVGLMIILSQLNVNISPLIASLGIGGLAIALALQPTLASFMAGTFVMADGVMKKGDYIELAGGPEGFVETIGWRTTVVRHWQGNLIVIPNSKLADAIVTNYETPDKSMVFTVVCGVSYESDLARVEQVALEVAQDITKARPEATKDFAPVLRWTSFGDSNINFAMVFKGVDRVSQFIIKHEFIKALHARFQKEGIEMNYPARKLQFSNDLHVQVHGKALAQIARELEEPDSAQMS
jgi:small-conductance mechanosensitive channel